MKIVEKKKPKYSDKNWIGAKFNRLTVVDTNPTDNDGSDKYWKWGVRCDCGTKFTARAVSVVSGSTKSCGCLRKEKCGFNSKRTHQESKTRLYRIWQQMRYRCDPITGLERYGKRGIAVCEEWDNSYECFRDWAKSSGYNDGLTIERIDVDGNYCPQNCKWIPLADQALNRGSTHWVVYKGETVSLAKVAKTEGIPYSRLYARITMYKMTIEEALHCKIHGSKKPISVLQKDDNGNIVKSFESVYLAAKETGVPGPNIFKCIRGERNRAGGFIWEAEQSK